MKAEIELRGKDLTAQATNSAKKNIRSVVEEASKAAKTQKQSLGKLQKEYAQNAYREVAQTQRAGIAAGTASGAAAVHQQGIIQGAILGTGSVAQGLGFGGATAGLQRMVGGVRNMFGGGGHRAAPTAGHGGTIGGGGGGGGGEEGVVGSAGSKIAPLLAGTGAVVGIGLGLINSIGKRHDELMQQQEQTYRVLGMKTMASEEYGLSSSRVAQQKLSYATATGNEHVSERAANQYMRLAGTFGLSDEEAGKTAAYLHKSGSGVVGAEQLIRGQTTDKIQAKAYFEQLGDVLEQAAHQGILSGMKNSDLGTNVAKGLSALYGVKVNGEQLSAARAGEIHSNLTGGFQQASKFQGGAFNAMMFAGVKAQMEKAAGGEVDVLDVMKRLQEGASGRNLSALEGQMGSMGMNRKERVLALSQNAGMSIQEAEAFTDQGFGKAKKGTGEFSTTRTEESQLRAKGENLLLGEEAAIVARARHTIQNKMLDFAGSTAKGVHELIKKFDKYFGDSDNMTPQQVMQNPTGIQFIDSYRLYNSMKNAPKATSKARGAKAVGRQRRGG